MIRIAASLALLVIAGLAAAGCAGGGKDIDAVRGCLEELGLTVEEPPSDDADIEDGVFATTDLAAAANAQEGDDETEFTFALAAIVTKDDARDNFQEQSRQFADTADEDGKLEFDSGTDGDYVWVAGGETGSSAFDDVRGCVEP